MINFVETLIKSNICPHEDIIVTRKVAYEKPDGSEDVIEEQVGRYTVFAMPPDTTNNADGAILERLLAGDSTKKVMIVYGVMPEVKEGDYVQRIQTDNYIYEVQIVSPHGVGQEKTPITHDKLYIVLKDNQRDV